MHLFEMNLNFYLGQMFDYFLISFITTLNVQWEMNLWAWMRCHWDSDSNCFLDFETMDEFTCIKNIRSFTHQKICTIMRVWIDIKYGAIAVTDNATNMSFSIANVALQLILNHPVGGYFLIGREEDWHWC